MAPMLLTIDNELGFELAFAPHMIKAEAAVPYTTTQTPVVYECQICFDGCVESDTITAFCGASCPAVLCRGCLAEHVRLSVDEAFAGVLPRVRCPICLIPVGKATWESKASSAVVEQYVDACRTACSFQTPCCHEPSYTHLPYATGETDLPSDYIKPNELKLKPPYEAKLEGLHAQTRRFCDREISSKDWMIYLEETFGRFVGPKKQLLILEHELPLIADAERRATLLLAYHAKYTVVKTRCCGWKTCFNCKRHMKNHADGVCDVVTIDADCVIECRACHVTMVKVDGCSAVSCWCGFAMDWDREVRVRDHNKKQLIPVDVYDLTTYEAWAAWRLKFKSILTYQLFPKRRALRIVFINEQLTTRPGLRETLQKLFQGPYIWRRHFRRALRKTQTELERVRMGMLARRLRKNEAFVVAVGRAKWRLRFTRMLPQLIKRLADQRVRRLTMQLVKSEAFVESVRRAKWWTRWTKVVSAVHAKQFWDCYKREQSDEQLALERDERALLLPGF